MQKKGIKFITGNFPNQIIKKNSSSFNVIFSKSVTKKFDVVMEAVGREANVKNLNLNTANVNLSKNNSIVVNDFFQTSNKNIYAIGDVIDRIQLTPVAIAEAMNLINNLVNKKKLKFNYNNIPTAVFSNPKFSMYWL